MLFGIQQNTCDLLVQRERLNRCLALAVQVRLEEEVHSVSAIAFDKLLLLLFLLSVHRLAYIDVSLITGREVHDERHCARRKIQGVTVFNKNSTTFREGAVMTILEPTRDVGVIGRHRSVEHANER